MTFSGGGYNREKYNICVTEPGCGEDKVKHAGMEIGQGVLWCVVCVRFGCKWEKYNIC